MGTGVRGDRLLGIVAAVEHGGFDTGDTAAFLEDTGLLVWNATAVEKTEPFFAHIVACPESAGPRVEIAAADTEDMETGSVDIAASPADVRL